MVWLLVIIALSVLLLRLYPLALYHWFDAAASKAEREHQEKVDTYLRELHEKIVGMKTHLEQSSLDEVTRRELQQLCDEFERDLRDEFLEETAM